LTPWICYATVYLGRPKNKTYPSGSQISKAAKTIVGILERHAEGCSMIGKFDGERIRVWCIDEGISAHRGIALRVRERRSVFIRLDETLGSVAADDGEKRVRSGC